MKPVKIEGAIYNNIKSALDKESIYNQALVLLRQKIEKRIAQDPYLTPSIIQQLRCFGTKNPYVLAGDLRCLPDVLDTLWKLSCSGFLTDEGKLLFQTYILIAPDMASALEECGI